jgi:hypothetical protein
VEISYNEHRNCKHYVLIKDMPGYRGCSAVGLHRASSNVLPYPELFLLAHDEHWLCEQIKTCSSVEYEEPECR